jgi:uncharacterized protein (TIGR03086 family)
MELDRAFQSTLAVLAKVQPDQLDRRTPCASWDVRALISHFITTTRWWAATVSGDGEPGATDFTAERYVAAYEESIAIAVGTFSAEGALDRTVRLPFGEFTGAALLGMAATEQFTHGWDLARATGQPEDLDPELAVVLLDGSRQAITDAFRGPDGQAFFGPAREAPPGTPAAGQLAAFLGRTTG